MNSVYWSNGNKAVVTGIWWVRRVVQEAGRGQMTPRFESQGNVFPLEVFKEEYDVV